MIRVIAFACRFLTLLVLTAFLEGNRVDTEN
jgi:hypothetical protein